MTEGSEAADQVVRMMLSGGEVSVRLAGSALKNGITMLLALIKNHKRVYGKINMTKLLRETRDIRSFSMTAAQFRQFQTKAKQFKLLYSAVQERHDRFSPIDVILPVTELERANMVFEKIRFVLKGEKANTERQVQEREAPERKKESRSERDSHGTRDSSFTSRSDERSKTTNERPSVLEKLKGFAEEKQAQRVPTKQKTKSRPKAM